MAKNKKQQILDYLKNWTDSPQTVQKIARGIGLPKSYLKTLKRLLSELESEGKIVSIRGNRYGMTERMDLVVGHMQLHRDGYGFLIPEKAGEPDVFIKAHHLREIMDGDKVVVRVEKWKAGRKREGSIVRVIERTHQQIVGRYEKHRGVGYVVPIDPRLNQDIVIPHSKGVKVRSDQWVVAQLVSYPSRQRSPEGKIIKVLGDVDVTGIETEAIIHNYQLPIEFPDKVLQEAESFPAEVELADSSRCDFRDWVVFTIDGENARDFDDAVSISPRQAGGWKLGVHIADVSHYVKPGSHLDKEAYKRGCSVYFLDRVLPMLPEKLSNELCSLKPNVDRLTFSALMDFSPEGKLLGYELVDSVIKSCTRLTYTEVRALLEDDNAALCKKYAHILPTIQEMGKLAAILKQRRIDDGSLDFDLPEPEIVLDLQGQPQDIIKRERNVAHELIEDFMLAANRTVATHMTKMELPFIYRIHEKPDSGKIVEFAEFVKNFGYNFEVGWDIKPSDLQKVLPQIKDKPEETIITINMLRSLKLARYSTNNVGHFGLAMPFYTHFTSPIRRYPDLIVHRLLRQAKNKKKLSDTQQQAKIEQLEDIAQQSSMRERVAEKAERDIVSIKRAQFMESKLGEEFVSIVSGVSPHGVFIELEDLYIEGLVHVSNMRDDYYHYLDREHVLLGERTKQRYQIGDKLLVQVERVDVDRRQIDFIILKQLESSRAKDK